MFGRHAAGFEDTTDAELMDLFGPGLGGLGNYIEDNTNVETVPLGLEDAGNGLNIRTEDDALDTGTPDLDEVLDEIDALQADARKPVS